MATGLRRAEIAERQIGHNGTKHHPEAVGQSFKENQIVKLVAGEVTVGAGQSNEKILGLAKKDATGVQGSMIPVEEFDVNTVIRMAAYHATPASAITAAANVGVATQYTVQSNKSVVDVANIGVSANAVLVISGYEGTVGEAYGYYLVKPKAANLQFNS